VVVDQLNVDLAGLVSEQDQLQHVGDHQVARVAQHAHCLFVQFGGLLQGRVGLEEFGAAHDGRLAHKVD